MIFLYILLGILALLLLILLCNVHVVFEYRQKPRVTVRILFLRFDGMDLLDAFTKEREPKKGKKKEVSNEAEVQKPRKRKGDLLGFAEFLIRITKIFSLAIKEQASRTKVNLKELHVLVGTDDAAQTALLCGGAIQAANFLCALLQRFTHFRCDNRNLSISPDFTSEKSRFSIHLILTLKVYHLIDLFFRSYFRLFEGKDVNYERNSTETSH